MNLATRCFGYYHLPNEIAMCPLMDLLNHTADQSKVRFILKPDLLYNRMFSLDMDRMTARDLERNECEQALGLSQQCELETLCRDNNQHYDEYPDTYFNYRPLKILTEGTYPSKKAQTKEF